MNKIGKYVANQILTASPGELLVMVYDEGIRTLKKAEAACAIEGPERIEMINKHLLHAQDVLVELSLSLNMEKGGEVATNLARLYDFMQRHIRKANVEKSLQPITEVRELMTTLRDAWQQILEKEQTAQDAAPRLNFTNNRILAAG